jgi:hypothetical protein
MNFSTTPEFDKELKAFTKKWRSLPNDFVPVRQTLPLLYKCLDGEPETALQLRREQFFNTKRASILTTTTDGKEVVKMRLDCASLGSKDILRLIFVCVRDVDTITFIELYAKNDKNKEREDQSRIQRYI